MHEREISQERLSVLLKDLCFDTLCFLAFEQTKPPYHQLHNLDAPLPRVRQFRLAQRIRTVEAHRWRLEEEHRRRTRRSLLAANPRFGPTFPTPL